MLSSLSIILSHIVFLHLIRRAFRRSNKIPDGVKSVLLSGICSFELGCVGLEQGVLLDHYGMAVWSLSLVLVVIWQIIGWEGISPNPLPHLLDRTTKGLLSVVSMLVGSLLSYRHMQTIWTAEMSNVHSGRALATSSQVCSLPWTHVPLYQVILCELVGTLLLTVIPRYIMEHETLANNDPNKLYRAAIISCVVLTVITAGMNISGAMYNPTMATLLIGGCEGYTWSQHLLIYWITPILGALLGTVTYPWIVKEVDIKQKSS